MQTSRADVSTDRAGRYLAQLCGHGDRMSTLTALHGDHGHGGGAAPTPLRAEWSGADGIIEFGDGRCTLRATRDGLELRAEAADEQRLRRIQETIAARLQRIGRRDGLTVDWQPMTPGTATDENAS